MKSLREYRITFYYLINKLKKVYIEKEIYQPEKFLHLKKISECKWELENLLKKSVDILPFLTRKRFAKQ
jgi:hypothetical protein